MRKKKESDRNKVCHAPVFFCVFLFSLIDFFSSLPVLASSAEPRSSSYYFDHLSFWASKDETDQQGLIDLAAKLMLSAEQGPALFDI
jgi:hypothetical protein